METSTDLMPKNIQSNIRRALLLLVTFSSTSYPPAPYQPHQDHRHSARSCSGEPREIKLSNARAPRVSYQSANSCTPSHRVGIFIHQAVASAARMLGNSILSRPARVYIYLYFSKFTGNPIVKACSIIPIAAYMSWSEARHTVRARSWM